MHIPKIDPFCFCKDHEDICMDKVDISQVIITLSMISIQWSLNFLIALDVMKGRKDLRY